MTAPSPLRSEPRDESQLMQALQEYRAAREAGIGVDRGEFLAGHAEIAQELAQCLAALDFVYEAAPKFQESASEPSEKGLAEPIADASDTPAHLPLGDYQIVREIGRGGMGVVYEAIQLSLGRRVALKVLPFASTLDAKQLQRFKNEAQAAAGLHHTNIVPVFATGSERGVHYYAMQFIEGQTLAFLIQELRHSRSESPRQPGPELQRGSRIEDRGSKVGDRVSQKRGSQLDQARTASYAPKERVAPEGGVAHPATSIEGSERTARESTTVNELAAAIGTAPVPPRSSLLDSRSSGFFRTVANLGIQAAEAMEHAHQLGVIHRDIKPANLMVETGPDLAPRGRGDGGEGLRLWITDFGLAHCQGGCELTMSGDLLGTLRYMSPEQALAKRVIVDERTDIYSLGVTLYELLTLEPAFPGTDRQELLRQIAFEEPRPPRRLNAGVPPELETIVLKAIEKNPADRYATAQEFADDLRRFLEDKPIRARRPTLGQRARKWARRHPGVAWMAATLLVVVAVVSTFSAVWLKSKSVQLTEAERQARLGQAEALVGKAHGIRLSKRPGQRFESLAALGKAAAIGRELELPLGWFDQLRNETIAALALPDIHITQELEVDPETTWVEMNDDFSLYVCANDKGECTIHRFPDPYSGVSEPHTPVWRLPAWGEPVKAVFGAGRTLGISGASGRFELWDLSNSDPVRRFEDSVTTDHHEGSHFRQDGRLVALRHEDRSISVRDSTTGERVYRLSAGKIIQGHPILHPSEPFVAIFHYLHPEFQVADLRTGAIIAEPLPPWPRGWPRGNSAGAWSPDGRTLTVPAGDAEKIQQYAFDPSGPTLKPTQPLDNPANGCPTIAYNRTGDRFVSRGWGTNVALFDAISGRVLFTTPAFPPASCLLRLDPTGKRLAAARTGDRKEKVGLWSVADAREYRALVLSNGQEGWSQYLQAIHPGGRLAAMPQGGGVALFDLESGRELAEVPVPSVNDLIHPSLAFDGAGNLLITSMNGAFRWPVRMDAANPARIVVGPPERLPLKPGRSPIAASRDGQVIAQCMWFGYEMEGGGWILHPDSPVPHQVDAGASMRACGVTPDGRWVAFAGGGKTEVHIKVYEAATLKCVFQRPSKYGSYARFTPDGHWLVTEIDGGQVYEAGTWAPGPRLGPGTPWDATADVAVLAQPNGIYRLVELASGRELARLEDPDQVTGAAVFTPDGSKLVVTAKDGLRVWDLRRIRQELGQLGLDWDGPPYFGGQVLQPDIDSGQARKPDLQVKVDQGDLDLPEKIKVLNDQVFAHVREAKWQEAAADCARLAKLDPNNHWYWFINATFCLHIGDTNGYRRVCREMLARFANTDKPEIAERIAKACSLAPNAVSDFGPVLKLADRAVTGTEKYPNYWWLQLAKCLTEYRAGHDEAAIEWLNRFAPRVDGNPSDATAFATLAMAKFRLSGRRQPPEPGERNTAPGAEATRLDQEARAALAHAEAILLKMPDPKAGRPFGTNWPFTVREFHDWLHAQILCREAEALLGMKEEKTQHQDTKDTKKSEDRRLRIENRKQ